MTNSTVLNEASTVFPLYWFTAQQVQAGGFIHTDVAYILSIEPETTVFHYNVHRTNSFLHYRARASRLRRLCACLFKSMNHIFGLLRKPSHSSEVHLSVGRSDKRIGLHIHGFSPYLGVKFRWPRDHGIQRLHLGKSGQFLSVTRKKNQDTSTHSCVP